MKDIILCLLRREPQFDVCFSPDIWSTLPSMSKQNGGEWLLAETECIINKVSVGLELFFRMC